MVEIQTRLLTGVSMLVLVVAFVGLSFVAGWEDRPLVSAALMSAAMAASFVGWLNASRPEGE